jgi:hypothetical protein
LLSKEIGGNDIARGESCSALGPSVANAGATASEAVTAAEARGSVSAVAEGEPAEFGA